MTAQTAASPAARSIETWTLVATILASSMAFIDGSALSIVQSILQRDFNADYNLIAWVINGYNLMLAALILVGGSLGDQYGRKRIFLIGIVIFTAASLACGLAPTIELLIIARIVQGIGGALMVPGSLALITAVFPSERHGAAIGTWSAAGALMVIVGPVLGGQFAAADFWRGVFFINLPIALVALYGLTRVPESRDNTLTGSLDIPGALLATLGLAGITYGFTEAPSQGWTQPVVLIALVGGIAALVAFVIVEARSREPMMPLRLFRSRTFSGTNLLTLFLYAGLTLVSVFAPLNLLEIQNYPPEIASLALLPLAISLIILSRVTGGLVGRIGARWMLTIGPIIAGIGMFLLGVPGITSGAGEYWTTFFPGSLLLGIGMGITVAPLTTAVMGSAPTEMSGTASGINNAVSRAAGVLAIAIFTALALTVFNNGVQSRVAPLNLSADVQAQLANESAKLANAGVPDSIPAADQPAVADAQQWAFVETFRMIMWSAAGLAFLSAIMAFVLVEDRKR
ncbi:MAG: MFS transporter [Chloroflexota bacterium]|nr:MFS transporter [Chloroflexota bacterium]